MAKVTIMKRDGGADLEHLPALLESVRSIVEDDDLTERERESMLRETLEQYSEFTGRSGLDDIAAIRGYAAATAKGNQAMNYQNLDRVELANFALECAANAIRKAQPHLSREQAFAKAYTDPANRLATQIERQASRDRLAGMPIARIQPALVDPDDDADSERMADEIRAENPFITAEEMYLLLRNSREERTRRAAFRAAMSAGNRASSALPRPQEVAIVKREDALSALREKANDLRKVMPSLSQEGAFAKVYKLYPELAKAEREASRGALYG